MTADESKEKAAEADFRLLIAGGGTGGHIYPGVAVHEQLLKDRPGLKALWVGSPDRMEAKKALEAGIDIRFIKVKGFRRSAAPDAIAANLGNALQLASLAPVRQALKIIRSFKPDIILGTGGYVCGPVFLAAAIADVPGFLLEPNAKPGLTNRMVSRLGVRVGAAFAETAEGFRRKSQILHTGIPVRRLHTEMGREAWLSEYGLSSDLPVILATGGSLGARDINNAIIGAARILSEDGEMAGRFQILHQTGDKLYEEAKQSAGEGWPFYRAVPFIKDMTSAMAHCSAAVSRAGAVTLAEIAVAGKPSILAPYPFAADDHQTANARAMERAGAAVMVESKALTPERLAKELKILLNDGARMAEMKAASERVGMFHQKAAGVVAAELLRLAQMRKIERGRA